MKLNKLQFENLKTHVESVITGLMETMISDTSDDYYVDQVIDNLDGDLFEEEDYDEIREEWFNTDTNGGIDDDLYKKFVNDFVNSLISKFK